MENASAKQKLNGPAGKPQPARTLSRAERFLAWVDRNYKASQERASQEKAA